MSKPTPCPCGTGRPYRDCCGVFIEGAMLPDTAERLMRSRYTAYCLGDTRWIRETWHPATRPPVPDLDSGVRWIGLKILGREAGGSGDARGAVEFVARYKFGGRAFRLHERSRFLREEGRWYYLDGAIETGDAPGEPPPVSRS